MAKSEKIIVKGTEINVLQINHEDYICITDMIKAKDGEFFVSDWLRNRNTLEYIGIWEKVYNPAFNYGEFAIIKSQSGLNHTLARRSVPLRRSQKQASTLAQYAKQELCFHEKRSEDATLSGGTR